MKKVCLDRVTHHHFVETKLDPIDDLFIYLSELKSTKYTKSILVVVVLLATVRRSESWELCWATFLGVSKMWAPFQSNCHNLKNGK